MYVDIKTGEFFLSIKVANKDIIYWSVFHPVEGEPGGDGVKGLDGFNFFF